MTRQCGYRLRCRTQRGFATLYLALGVGAVVVALGIALKVQSARLDAAQQQNKALAQQVSQWQGAATQCSDATLKAKVEADKRQQAALAALQAVRKASDASRSEAARLKALIGANTVTACPAKEAVDRVRDGLNPSVSGR